MCQGFHLSDLVGRTLLGTELKQDSNNDRFVGEQRPKICHFAIIEKAHRDSLANAPLQKTVGPFAEECFVDLLNSCIASVLVAP